MTCAIVAFITVLFKLRDIITTTLLYIKVNMFLVYLRYSPVENQIDPELDFKVFFFADSCCSDLVLDESN